METSLARILQQEVDFIRRVGALSSEMQRHPDYSPQSAYRTLVRTKSPFIRQVQLREIYGMFGCFAAEQELCAIIRRIDTDGDGSLGFDEFTDFFVTQINEEAALLSRSPKPPPPSSQ